MLDGPRLAPASGGPARKLVILLHGVGANGRDLIDIGAHWAPIFPDAAFAAPDAPDPSDWDPAMRQWFRLGVRDAHEYWLGAAAAAPKLDAFIDAELAHHGLVDADLALVGFSQGTMMALQVGPRRARPMAGIIGYSGRIAGPERLAAEARSRPPVLLVHGAQDEVIPVAALAETAAVLRGAGFRVETIERPGLPHGIDAVGLSAGAAFLRQVFGTAAA
ncbi:dienelactone hydrolase family protein [Kaistia dalseonensis]|uniref:Phospholipase/carboxylesterase n=1 Tax=Kaistia dalseonensis TaxID=410840 RepID=A0ABU0H3S4_9HYPH|nr:dienelactone hydrolase family protein [Kaistia dalseonensis]MCX5494373.1 dienelactone hydrolase family protein [Kaistia dalseonensis]MDQ0436955.1 phospholipase/carboxylesterase [Kaistia dalseonensis]